jgi:hypothetical protein
MARKRRPSPCCDALDIDSVRDEGDALAGKPGLCGLELGFRDADDGGGILEEATRAEEEAEEASVIQMPARGPLHSLVLGAGRREVAAVERHDVGNAARSRR